MAENYLVTYQRYEIEDIWPEVEPVIKKSLKKAETYCNMEDIKDFLLQGKFQLWTSRTERQLQAFCLTHIAIYPNHKICEIYLCGGFGLRDWLKYLSNVETWAMSIGCEAIEFQGRFGWLRKLTQMDYEPFKIVMRKNLWEVNQKHNQVQQHR